MIQTTLVLGSSAFEREQAIAAELAAIGQHDGRSAVLLEGLGSGQLLIAEDPNTSVVRIAAGCLCCSNNMILRIYLNRLIRQKPQRLFLSLSTEPHLDQLKQYLSTADYQNILEVSKVLNLNSTIA
ncbi:G3E family GTPase [Oxalobacteraceae bacterium GrIS 2.11]